MSGERGVDEWLDGVRRVLLPGPHLDRRLGRVFAFGALYEMDLAHRAPEAVLERLASAWPGGAEAAYPPEVLSGAAGYAGDLVRGVLAEQSAIDGLIQARAPLWPLHQMSAVDRNVLRIGLYESLYGNATVPLRTAINEAVELAKLFGSETSAKFVNGVLGRAVEASASGGPPPGAAHSEPAFGAPEGAPGGSIAPTAPDPPPAPHHQVRQEKGVFDDGHER